MTDAYEAVYSCISTSCQYSSVPKRYVSELLSLFLATPEVFPKAFQNIFLQLGPSFHKDPQSERGLKSLFSVLSELRKQADESKPEILNLFTVMLKLLITGCEAREKSPRYASAWFLDRMLSLNLQEMPLPSYIFPKISKVIEDLLKDKHSSIRFHAVSIARKCDLNTEFIKAMSKEPIKDIRKYMISMANTDKRSCKAVSKRLRDLEPTVRLAACKKLQDISDFTYCKEILVMCVVDRSKEVREAAGGLLKNFIKQSGLMKLAEIIELKNTETKRQREMFMGFKYVCESVATTEQLCELISVNIVELGQLTMEQLLLLRISIETLRESNENLLYSLMPDLETLNITHIHTEFPLFYTQNLLKMSLCLDLGEEFTRLLFMNTLRSLCIGYPLRPVTLKESHQICENYSKISFQDYLPTTDQDVFSQIIFCIRFLLKDQETEFCRVVIEIINEIRDPLCTKEQGEVQILESRQCLNSKLQNLSKEEEALGNEIERLGEFNVHREIIIRRQEILTEINSMQCEVDCIEDTILRILHRSLVLSCELLRFTRHGVMDAELTEIVQTLIYPSLRLKEKFIHVLAIECLGLFCISHAVACKEYLYIFKVILQKKTVENGILEYMAIKSVMDFYMVFEFNDSEEGSNMLEIIMKYLASTNLYIKALVVEGLCKLLLLERNKSAEILAKLLLEFFDSSSPDMVKQVLHVFFTHYPLVSEVNAKNLAEAFILTLALISENINKAYTGVDLSNINLNKIFSFVFMYLNPEYLKLYAKFQTINNLHFYLFYALCTEILQHNSKSQAKVYPRMLIQLNFSSFSTKELIFANSLLGRIKKIVKEKICANAVARIIENISKLSERLDGNFEDLETALTKKYEDTVEKVCKFLKGYQHTGLKVARELEFDDPIEYSADDIATKRGSSSYQNSEKKIKRCE